MQGFTGSKESQQYDIASISYKYKGREYTLKAVVTDKIPQHNSHKGLEVDIRRLKNMNCHLADPNLTENTPITILIGGDYYYDLVHPGYERDGTLILLPTICGYALTGTRKTKEVNTQVEVITVLKVTVTPLEETLYNPEYVPPKEDLNKLWELDHIGILPNEITQEIRDTVEKFKQSITYDEQSNQYSVRLPWRENKAQLPSNYGLALGRMRSLQHTFIKNKEYCDQYTNVLADQLNRGFIERVHPDNKKHDVHYLPHHGVKKDSLTTPVRIVYDCSAKQASRSLGCST